MPDGTFKISETLVLTMIRDKDMLAECISDLLKGWGINAHCEYHADGEGDCSGTFTWTVENEPLRKLMQRSKRLNDWMQKSFAPLSMLYSPQAIFSKGCKYCIQFYYPNFEPRDMERMASQAMNSEDPIDTMYEYGPQFKVQRVETIADLKYAVDKWFNVQQMQKHFIEIMTSTDTHKRYRELKKKKDEVEHELRDCEQQMFSLMSLTIKKCEKYCQIENEKLSGLK